MGDMIFDGTAGAHELVDPSFGPAITVGAFVNPPGPLAVNPSLTIAAVSERIAHWMVYGKEAE